jgi:hypothetical protein
MTLLFFLVSNDLLEIHKQKHLLNNKKKETEKAKNET